MIFVERTSEPPEARKWSGREQAESLVRNYLLHVQDGNRQARLDLMPFMGRFGDAVRRPLLAMFEGRCAYCEALVGAGGAEVDRFRPVSAASDLDGKGSIAHYAWLAFEWENQYLACALCVRRSRGRRALPAQVGRRRVAQSVRRKAGLLVACLRMDEPSRLVHRLQSCPLAR